MKLEPIIFSYLSEFHHRRWVCFHEIRNKLGGDVLDLDDALKSLEKRGDIEKQDVQIKRYAAARRQYRITREGRRRHGI